ncbi:hypothetical protein [Ferrimonas balearica]|uniref:hypothetical protein n=1 Tax=Ferrimonas balearica TaxID=44012 RepID=UPI001F1B5825|nr:hypothetical protein [Ferrimonas balearica]MBY6093832.1 hypothetical protein [Ferrimonas balearica]
MLKVHRRDINRVAKKHGLTATERDALIYVTSQMKKAEAIYGGDPDEAMKSGISILIAAEEKFSGYLSRDSVRRLSCCMSHLLRLGKGEDEE